MTRDYIAALCQALAIAPMIGAAGMVAWRAQSGGGPGWLIGAGVLLLLAWALTELSYRLPEGPKGKKSPPLVREHKQGTRVQRKPHHENQNDYNTAA